MSGQLQQQYLFDHIGPQVGLVSEETMSIRQDKKGFLWIATLDGLQRYDGRRFLTFRNTPGSAGTIPNDNVYTLVFDSKDRLWIRFAENRIGYFNTTDYSFHEVPVKYPEGKLRVAESRLIKDNEDHIMFLVAGVIYTYDDHLDLFTPDSNPFTVPLNWKINFLSQDMQENNYWIGCDSGLVKYDLKHKIMSYRGHNSQNDEVINAYSELKYVSNPYLDKAGRFWLYGWPPAGPGPFLFSYDKNSRKKTDWEPQISRSLKGMYHQVTNIQGTTDGKVWLTGANLFAMFNENLQCFEAIISNLPGEYSIRFDGVRELYEDREHNLWVCTDQALFRFNPMEQFCHAIVNKRYDKDSSFSADVSDILQTRSGEILVGTWGEGLFSYDNNFKPVKTNYVEQSRKLGEGLTWCILQRENGDVWRGNQDGYLFISHLTTKTTERLQPAAFEKATIRQICEDKDGNIWLGTHRGHIIKWNAAENSFSLIKKLNGIIERLYTDLKGSIWVCTQSDGVYCFNSNNNIAYHLTSESPEGKRLYKIYAKDIVQYNDSLYMIASGCLNVLNISTNKIRFLTGDDGYPANNVSNIIKDRNGYLWMTSTSGLCSINFEKDVVTTYNERDGVHTNSFNAASANMLQDGRIVIGTAHDILLFDPNNLARTAVSIKPPDVIVTSVSLMNKRLRLDSLMELATIDLEYDKTSLVIEFSTLTYLNSYGVFYMMEGLDKDWKISYNGLQATFNYLPPGTYSFKAMVKNGDNIQSKNIVLLKIKVHAPFWMTWWFYSLILITVVAIVYVYDRERMKRKEAMHNMRSEIANNLHEEVNTALNNINILSEMAKIKADSEPGKSKEYIEQINTKSHNMIIAMDDMLWSLRPDNDHMDKTLERIREYIDALKNRHGVNIDISVDQNVESLELNMKLRHEAFLLFKETIRSLVYAGIRKCDIQVGLQKPNLLFTMQFENAGCDMQQLNNLLHRHDMEKHMQAIDARLDVQVHKSNSIFELQVPV